MRVTVKERKFVYACVNGNVEVKEWDVDPNLKIQITMTKNTF